MIGAIIAGITGLAGLGASAVGAVGAGALGLAGLGASAVGGIASGIGGLFAGPATFVNPMAVMGAPATTAATGAGVLGGVASAASSTIGYLGELAPAAAGLYSLIKPPEQKVTAQVPGAVPSVTAPAITKSPLPIFSQQPQLMTVGGTVAQPKETNYILYIGLALVALLLLRKK